jgi:FMN phosphatase YigB (HAD superfamily)
MNKIILTDCDGVLLNWEGAFTNWMSMRGYKVDDNNRREYHMGKRYGISSEEKDRTVRAFNESAWMKYLNPLRDAVYYVDLLHRKHGYTFHMCTSLTTDEYAQKLRIENIERLFGKTAFTKYIFCDTGADKDEALKPYRDSGYLWVEDKVENAELGLQMGLDSVLISHPWNINHNNDHIPKYRYWKELYEGEMFG